MELVRPFYLAIYVCLFPISMFLVQQFKSFCFYILSLASKLGDLRSSFIVCVQLGELRCSYVVSVKLYEFRRPSTLVSVKLDEFRSPSTLVSVKLD